MSSLRKGTIHTKSSKQTINTKSSTELEVIGVSDFIPWTMWLKRILKEQRYIMKSTIFYQDNESAMKMEKNGLKSCGDKSRHINIRYFFIKDVLEREGIYLKYYGIENMIADFLTKLLQGILFRGMRDVIMGHNPFPTEERVDNYRKVRKVTTGVRSDVRTKIPTYTQILKKGNMKAAKPNNPNT